MSFSGSSSKIVRVPMTQDRDLILTMDFDKKIIEIESDHWTTVAKRKNVESPDLIASTTTIPPTTKKEKGGTEKETPSFTTPKKISLEIPQSDVTEIAPNKKVQLSKEEQILQRIIEVFDSLAETSFNEHSVNAKTLKNNLEARRIISYGEFNKFLNTLLEKDIIEYVSDQPHLSGFYRRKK